MYEDPLYNPGFPYKYDFSQISEDEAEEYIDSIFEEAETEINSRINALKYGEALGVINSVLSGLTVALASAHVNPKIARKVIARIQAWLNKIKAALEAIAQAFNAQNYYVEFSTPYTFTVGLLFNTPPCSTTTP